jgi:hypothetical protein
LGLFFSFFSGATLFSTDAGLAEDDDGSPILSCYRNKVNTTLLPPDHHKTTDADRESALLSELAVRTESEKPHGAPHLAFYLTEHMRPMLEEMGFVCEVLLAPTSSSAAGCPACRARGLRKAHQGRLGEPFQSKCHSSVTLLIQKQDVNSPVTEDSVSRQQLDIEILKCLKFERLLLHVHFAPYRYPA